MAEWLVEQGIGEHRAIRLSGERITHARMQLLETLRAGTVLDAKLVSRNAGSSRGLVRSDTGQDIVVDRLAKSASEGARLRIAIHRAPIAERGRLKLAQGRPTDAEPCQPSLADSLASGGDSVRIVRRFPVCDWDELLGEALELKTEFAGGSLLFASTPALTAIDVDGALSPPMLAKVGVPALADALQRFDIGGSIAVDFPTVADKADRKALDEALELALETWPHERTAINGFGLVQIVARLERPSLLQLASWQRGRMVWHRLLRRAEGLNGAGIIELAIAPALKAFTKPEDIEELARRSGLRVRLREDTGLAFSAPHAQLVIDG